MKLLAQILSLIFFVVGALTVNLSVIALGAVLWLLASVINKLDDAERSRLNILQKLADLDADQLKVKRAVDALTDREKLNL